MSGFRVEQAADLERLRLIGFCHFGQAVLTGTQKFREQYVQ
jgi:hypothetical protein